MNIHEAPWTDRAAPYDTENLSAWSREWEALSRKASGLDDTIAELTHQRDMIDRELGKLERAAAAELDEIEAEAAHANG